MPTVARSQYWCGLCFFNLILDSFRKFSWILREIYRLSFQEIPEIFALELESLFETLALGLGSGL